MPKLPIYEQQVSVQRKPTTGESFGAASAQATGQLGGVVSQIGEKIVARNEVIDRVRMSNQFDQNALQEFEAWQGAEDITDPEAVKTYNGNLRSKMEEIISNHKGRADSKAQLRAQLEQQYGNYSNQAIQTQIKAQHTMLANFIEQAGNKMAVDAMDAPDQIDNLIGLANSEVDKIMPVLNPSQEEAYRNATTQKIVNSAITGLLNKGQWETAKQILQSDNYNKFLSTSQSQQAAVDIAKVENKAIADQKRINNNIATFSAILGKDLRPDQIERIKLLPDQDEMTLSDKINQLEILQDSPASQDQINKLAGTYIKPEGGAGGTMTERFISRANELSTSFALGNTTPQENQEFLSIVNQLYGQKEVTDPITGLPRTVQVSMPLHIKQALQARGLAVESERVPGASPTQEATAGGERTVWDRAESISGPIPAIGAKLQRTPLIGQEFGINPQIAVDRQFIETQQKELIRSLAQNPRFPVAEMQALENEVNIGPNVWDNPPAYKQRLIGIDEAISKRIKNAADSLSTGNISGTERKNLMDALNVLTKFKSTLGVPIRVKSKEEAAKLPPGTQFIDPSGNVWTRSEETGEQK